MKLRFGSIFVISLVFAELGDKTSTAPWKLLIVIRPAPNLLGTGGIWMVSSTESRERKEPYSYSSDRVAQLE